MFARAYFGGHYFAPTYFPQGRGVLPVTSIVPAVVVIQRPEDVYDHTSGVPLFAYITDVIGGALKRSDFASINLKIWDAINPTVPINGGSGEDLTINDIVFDSLVINDIRCTLSAGFNFRYQTKISDLPVGGNRYNFEFKVMLTGATDPIWIVFEVTTLVLFSA